MTSKPTKNTRSKSEGFERVIQLRYGDDMGSLAGLEVDLWPVTVRQVSLYREPMGENETVEQVNRRRLGLLTGNPDSTHSDDREPSVISWNLQRRGKPIPVDDLDAVLNYDIAVVQRILGDWVDGCALPKDPDPKAQNSNGGSNTESSSVDEASIPTETLP